MLNCFKKPKQYRFLVSYAHANNKENPLSAYITPYPWFN